MKEILISPPLPPYLWLSATIVFIFTIILIYRKSTLLMQMLEIKDKDGFHQSIKTGIIPEEFLDELEPESVRAID
ncbi:hypothetical protein OZ668_15260 [Elizabethkingia sp. HX XZB]|uniref:hypothetical protein n=1 Tax=Elizabethkingia sp. HX XZB TaxID=3003193 RepID=UPI002A24DD53|nr:hypothetical protein [Elizabethkingia sp. HX XZB]MDX8569358.1 hypothetical protein [Elizabethkingia sp. HX XZB]